MQQEPYGHDDGIPEADEAAEKEAAELGRLAALWQEEAPAEMVAAYRLMTGLKPPQSWSWQVRKSAPRLAQIQLGQGERAVRQFLQESVVGFVLRCGGAFGREPDAPFFADTYLFSAQAIEYLNKHRLRIRKYTGASSDPAAFPQAVRDDVLQWEIDYWMLGRPNTPPDPSLAQPGLYWILLSRALGRFSRDGAGLDLERCWPAWDYSVDYLGRFVPVREAVELESVRLKADRQLRNMALEAAAAAVREAALVTWSRLGLGMVFTDARGGAILPRGGREAVSRGFTVEDGRTLWEWELEWRAYLCAALGDEFDPETFTHAALAIGRRRPVAARPPVAFHAGPLTGFMARALEKTSGED